jgi:acetyl-CoA acetyltransferase
MRGGWALDRDALYEQASAGAADMDFVQLYDDYPVMLAIQLEDMGFCAKYEAPRFIRENTFTFDGSVPLNTGGGQLSIGQAGAAGGYVAFTEALRQLSGAAGGRQVREARHGLVCGFGMINYDRGVCSGAAVLASAA